MSPHAPYTCSTEVYAACASLDLPVATHLNESGDELDWLLRGEGPWQPFSELLVEPDGQSGIRRLAAAGLLDERIVAAHCVKVDDEEIALLAAPRRRGRALSALERAARLWDRAARRAPRRRTARRASAPTASPRCRRTTSSRSCGRRSRSRARASERADALSAADALELATLGGARALGLEREIGSLVPGKRADIAIVSLSGSPYLPWEDPAAAVVYGGAPERVLATLVDGEARYERGGFEWHELIDAASTARGRMLLRTTGATAIS